ncbi:MAG: DUF4340 domain-containing protein, partial [Defluviitaleaceae bacterium]|nr:DUF4340 domain-containing protein [Defluviitaleaceae bacterium]
FKSAVFTQGGQSITVSQAISTSSDTYGNTYTYTVNDTPSLPVVQDSVDTMVGPCYSLIYYDKLDGGGDTLADYGLDPPQATVDVTYTDGSEAVIYVGRATPGQDYYYGMVSGDDSVYLLYNNTAKYLMYGLNDLIDKTVPAIDYNTLQYVDITQPGKDEIEFGFVGTEAEKQAAIDQYNGAVPLTLMKPWPGMGIYGSQFNYIVLGNNSDTNITITLGDLVEADANMGEVDTAKYGFDDPQLTFRITDATNDVHLIIGADIPGEDNMAYIMRYGVPVVYKIDKTTISSFFNVNVFGFIDHNVALQNIVQCTGMDIVSQDHSYTSVIDHTTVTGTPAPVNSDPSATPAATSAPQDVITATVNGQVIDSDTFRKFYRIVISLSYEDQIPPFTPTGSPEVTITFHLDDGTNIVTQYYDYNDDFYAVVKNGENLPFVVSKKFFPLMFDSADKMLAGATDF